MTIIARAGVVLALVSAGCPAFAEKTPDQAQAVQVADLDLATKAGVERLRLRIAAAADAVCGDKLQPLGLNDLSEVQQCVSDVKRATESQVAGRIVRVRTASAR